MTQSLSLNRLLRRPADSQASLESAALLVGALAFVIGGVIAIFVFWGRDLPIAGRGSLGEFVAIGSAITAALVFVLARLVLGTRRRTAPAHLPDGLAVEGARLHWFDLAAIALAHAVIALLGWVGVSDLLEQSFVDAVVFSVSAMVLAGVAIAVTAYVVFLSAAHLTPMLLSLVLALFLVVGALASMLSASDPHWWQKNLSALGVTDDVSALAFNLTLIVAGVIVTTIAHYATASLPAATSTERRGRDIVRIALILIGVLLACVGVFPLDQFMGAHNVSATGMIVVYSVVVIGLRRFIPSFPQVFVLLGYIYFGVIVVLAVFFVTGYYNLTAVELVVAVLIFSWIIVFLRNAGAMGTGTRADAPRSDGVERLPAGSV